MEWQEVQGLVQLLLASFFLVLGLHFLLYSHLTTHKLLKRYRDSGIPIHGDVLSCDPSTREWEIQVLYMATANKYADRTSSRWEFRYPDRLETKQYLRRFQSDHFLARGSQIPVLVLPGLAKSGLTKEFVEQKLSSHSHCKTILVLVPGLSLWAVTVYLQCLKVQEYKNDDEMGWLLLAISHALMIGVARLWSDARWQTERRNKYESAMAMQQTKAPCNQPPNGNYQLL